MKSYISVFALNTLLLCTLSILVVIYVFEWASGYKYGKEKMTDTEVK